MPFFNTIFFPKKVPSRKIKNRPAVTEDLFGPQRSIKLSLGDVDLMFSNGEWHTIGAGRKSSHEKNSRLQTKVEAQKEENNLLNLKYEVILNMLTQATAENHIQQKELKNLQKDKTMVD